MRLKKLFLIICSLMLAISIACGFAACGGDDEQSDVIPVASVGLNTNTLELEVDDTYKITATVLPSNATDKSITWSSDNPSVATVVGGLVTAKAEGNANVTAKAGNRQAVCAVKVKAKTVTVVPVTSVTLNQSEYTLEVGGSYNLIPTVLPANATDRSVTWSSSAPQFVTVSDKGLIEAKAVGSSTVTATAGGKSATCVVTVKSNIIAVTGVALDKQNLTLKIGETQTLKATVTPSNATDKNVKWSTSNDKVATVSDGAVVGVGEGEAKISAVVGGVSASCTVKVSANTVAVTGISLDKTSLTVEVGKTQKLTATVTPSDATDKAVVWTSSDEKTAMVSNGVVLGVGEGTATITATAGGKTATCTVTVEKAAPVIVPVQSVTLNEGSLELKVDETFRLVATVAPSNATETEIIWKSDNESIVTVDDGVVTAIAVGNTKIYATAGGVTAECEVGVIAKDEPVVPPDEPEQPITNSIITYAHAGEESAAFEWKETDAENSTVEYKLSTASAYTRVDAQLIRQTSADCARVDILGLKGGAKYDFKITSSDGKTATVKSVQISSYDRSGYAHFNYTSGVGAYNDDGTLKSNAVVLYVTEENKNNVDGKGNSIVEYLVGAKNNKNPIAVRFIGTVGAATWKKGNVTYEKVSGKIDKDGNLLPEAIVSKNGTQLEQREWTQAELLSKKYNELDTSVYAELEGLSSKIKWDSSKKEFDSCWNDCSLSNLSNVTIEGVGENARIFQWGITFKSSKSIEVRNITFEDYTEDACSFEGPSSDNKITDPSKYSANRIWLHNNTFEEGVNYWDVCKEQDKHDGDGSTDFKYVAFVTLSYNVYNGTHKTGLIGGSNDQYTASVTFHHNYYNGCKSRLPLARQANMHMYNNYYSGTTSTDISLRAGAYALVENCYFDGCNRAIELQHDETNGDGAAKVINCVMNKNKQDKYLASGVSSSFYYSGTDRTKTVSNDNKISTTFDTDTSLFYYDSVNKCSKVTEMLTANEVKTVIPEVAGVLKRKSNIKIDGGSEEEEPPVVIPPVVDPDNPETGKVTMNVTDAINTHKLTVDNVNKQDYTDKVLAEGITLTVKQGKVTEHSNEVGGVKFTHRIVIGKVSSSNTRYFKIETRADCLIKVYVANLGADDREIGLYTDTEGKNPVTGTVTTSISAGGAELVEISVAAAGTYYLESITGDLSIYQIEIIYSE